jgi:hypothetical protein
MFTRRDLESLIATNSQVFGDTPEAVHKAELIEFLRRLVAALDARMRSGTDPVVLAAQPEIQGHFRRLAHWRTLIPEAIPDNPDALDERTLHAKAWALIEPRVAAGPALDLERLNALLGSADARASLQVGEIVRAACYGRVDTLFVADGATLWGRFDPAADQLVAHDGPRQGDEDRLDYATIETLRHRGHVDLMPKAALPRERPVAAILRY